MEKKVLLKPADVYTTEKGYSYWVDVQNVTMHICYHEHFMRISIYPLSDILADPIKEITIYFNDVP